MKKPPDRFCRWASPPVSSNETAPRSSDERAETAQQENARQCACQFATGREWCRLAVRTNQAPQYEEETGCELESFLAAARRSAAARRPDSSRYRAIRA